MMKNILEYLEATALSVPEKLAFSDGKSDLTFGELQRASRAIGSKLISLGAKREAVVVFMDKHPNVMSAFFGVIYAGCFYACIDPKTPPERVKTIIENLGARIMIADARAYKKAEEFNMPILLGFDEISAGENTLKIILDTARQKEIAPGQSFCFKEIRLISKGGEAVKVISAAEKNMTLNLVSGQWYSLELWGDIDEKTDTLLAFTGAIYVK
jgi:acyl-CoA synthetase (AMP-forming)/AMP-acid ligase II